MRRTLLALAALTLCMPLATAVGKSSTPADGTIRLSGGSAAAGIGVSWGSGTLTFHGKSHPISVQGLDVGTVGASRFAANGSVFHLKKLEDFDGNYTAAQAGAAVGGGGGVLAMQNQNGVVVRLVSTTRGIKFTFGASGVKMELKK